MCGVVRTPLPALQKLLAHGLETGVHCGTKASDENIPLISPLRLIMSHNPRNTLLEAATTVTDSSLRAFIRKRFDIIFHLVGLPIKSSD